jgi:ATP-dependent 26S proteasome regulatory subunit
MLELMNQLDGFSSNERIKVSSDERIKVNIEPST